MEVYRSKDGHVAKYVHNDGSETAIKTTPIDKFGGEYGSVTNKFNVFISTSVGCPVGCKFCYLTTKKCPYVKLDQQEITKNVRAAIKSELKTRPELKKKYIKLSWMGMGDAYLNINDVYWSTLDILDTLVKDWDIMGVDGVDISTTMPRVNPEDLGQIVALNTELMKTSNNFNLNPERNYGETDRSPLRVFYSLHSTKDAVRRMLIPHTVDISKAFSHLGQLRDVGITTIIHHMFFDELNDGVEDLIELKNLMLSDLLKGTELRILRFNECPGTTFKESEKFDYLITVLLKHGIDLKVQSSPGSEIAAACGQFLLTKIEGMK